MEYFDVINEQDEIIGKASREECHRNPSLLHRTVHFTLIDKLLGNVLLSIRNPQLKFDGGKVCFMGEHIKSGESYEGAVTRGIQEELGFVPTEYSEGAHHIFEYAFQRELVRFFIASWNGEAINPDPDEISETHWVKIQDLKKEDSDYSEMTRYWIKHVEWEKFA